MNVQTDVSIRSKKSFNLSHNLFPCFCVLGLAYLHHNTFLILLSATQVLRLDYEICIRHNDYSLFEQIVVIPTVIPPCNLVPRHSLDFLPCKGPAPKTGADLSETEGETL